MYVISSLYDKVLEIKTFQRTASVYYKTHRIGSLLYLVNDINGNCLIINFQNDKENYLTMNSIKDNKSFCDILIPKPKFNSDLFKKIVSMKLI